MGRFVMGLAMALLIGGCSSNGSALQDDIHDVKTQRAIEQEREASHQEEPPPATAPEEASEPKEEFDYEKWQVEEAERQAVLAAERTAFNAQLPSSPEGMYTWVIDSINFATDGVEDVTMYCVEREDVRGGFGDVSILDEDADLIANWGSYREEDDTDRDYDREINKSFFAPVSITNARDAVNYLVVTLRHGGTYERPSVIVVRERLVDAFSRMQIPDFWDGSVDIARWREVANPLFLANIPSGAKSRTKEYGKPATLNEAFAALQHEVLERSGVHVHIEFRDWAYDSRNYFVVLRNGKDEEKVAFIDNWVGDLIERPIVNGHIEGFDFFGGR